MNVASIGLTPASSTGSSDGSGSDSGFVEQLDKLGALPDALRESMQRSDSSANKARTDTGGRDAGQSGPSDEAHVRMEADDSGGSEEITVSSFTGSEFVDLGADLVNIAQLEELVDPPVEGGTSAPTAGGQVEGDVEMPVELPVTLNGVQEKPAETGVASASAENALPGEDFLVTGLGGSALPSAVVVPETSANADLVSNAKEVATEFQQMRIDSPVGAVDGGEVRTEPDTASGPDGAEVRAEPDAVSGPEGADKAGPETPMALHGAYTDTSSKVSANESKGDPVVEPVVPPDAGGSGGGVFGPDAVDPLKAAQPTNAAMGGASTEPATVEAASVQVAASQSSGQIGVGGTAPTATAPALVSAARVLDMIEVMARQPPPRTLTLDLTDLYGVRVTLALDGGGVNVSVSDSGAGDHSAREWARQLDQLLSERDFGSDANSSDTPSQDERPNSERPAREKQPMSSATAQSTELRL